ncbi:hypothetical protein KIV56_03560 [Cryobacterium breve]|uniref:Uncharacterized protein n=1 Tax=Cryobacterium breve TaxID=1259258 RepID=A0ABY7NDG1_9MICO|nr:hypothetical protein [Cryobacterium breve]WBM80538.1 hypothetical protein KIV56_03560 [Cryobacterium breve]
MSLLEARPAVPTGAVAGIRPATPAATPLVDARSQTQRCRGPARLP